MNTKMCFTHCSGVESWALLFSRQAVPVFSLLRRPWITPILHNKHQTAARLSVNSLPADRTAEGTRRRWGGHRNEDIRPLLPKNIDRQQQQQQQQQLTINWVKSTCQCVYCVPEYIMRCNIHDGGCHLLYWQNIEYINQFVCPFGLYCPL